MRHVPQVSAWPAGRAILQSGSRSPGRRARASTRAHRPPQRHGLIVNANLPASPATHAHDRLSFRNPAWRPVCPASRQLPAEAPSPAASMMLTAKPSRVATRTTSALLDRRSARRRGRQCRLRCWCRAAPRAPPTRPPRRDAAPSGPLTIGRAACRRPRDRRAQVALLPRASVRRFPLMPRPRAPLPLPLITNLYRGVSGAAVLSSLLEADRAAVMWPRPGACCPVAIQPARSHHLCA